MEFGEVYLERKVSAKIVKSRSHLIASAIVALKPSKKLLFLHVTDCSKIHFS